MLQWPPSLPAADQLWAPHAPVVLLAWVALHAFIYLMPIGKVNGTQSVELKSSLINYGCDWRHYVRPLAFFFLQGKKKDFKMKSFFFLAGF